MSLGCSTYSFIWELEDGLAKQEQMCPYVVLKGGCLSPESLCCTKGLCLNTRVSHWFLHYAWCACIRQE